MQRPRLGKPRHGLRIFDTRVAFPVPVQSGVDSINLAYRTGQSEDLTVIGNPVFTLSRDLSFPYHVINGNKVLTVHTFYI